MPEDPSKSDPQGPEDPKDPQDPEDPQDPKDPQDPEDPDALGDKGKQALDRMKDRLKTAKSEAAEYKALGLTPAQIKELADAKKADDGDKVDPDKIREQARAEARLEAQKDRITDKIEARAAKAFADAEDAVAILLLNHDTEDFLDGDKIDVEAIQEALDDLLEKKPHLAAQGGRRFTGTADGGKRKADRPEQLTKDDLSRMSPAQIVKAKADGRFADLLSGSK